MLQHWYQSHSRPIKMYDTFIGDVCAKTAPSPAGRYVFVYFPYMQILIDKLFGQKCIKDLIRSVWN